MTEYKIDPYGHGKFLSEVIEENHSWLSNCAWDYLQEWEQLELTTIATEFVDLMNRHIEENLEYTSEDIGYTLYEITYPYWFDQYGSLELVWEEYDDEQKETFKALAQELMVLIC